MGSSFGAPFWAVAKNIFWLMAQTVPLEGDISADPNSFSQIAGACPPRPHGCASLQKSAQSGQRNTSMRHENPLCQVHTACGLDTIEFRAASMCLQAPNVRGFAARGVRPLRLPREIRWVMRRPKNAISSSPLTPSSCRGFEPGDDLSATGKVSQFATISPVVLPWV